MILYVLFITAGVFYGTWLYMRYHKLWKYTSRLPGLRGFPLVGSLPELGTNPEGIMKKILSWHKQFNHEMFCVYLGTNSYVVISDPKYMEAVLSSTKLTYKKEAYNYLQPWLGQGLLTSNGEYWVKHRKMITPSFHFRILQDFLHIMNETTERFVKFLNPLAEEENMFDFQEVICRSTLDIICECAMGYRLNSIEDGDQSPIVQALNEICRIITDRHFSVFNRADLIFYLSKEGRQQNRELKVFRNEILKIIEDRRKLLQKQSVTNNMPGLTSSEFKRPKMAFLDNLLTARIDGNPLQLQEIYEEVSTFIFEGHDTTASAIGFIVYCLSRHPEVQQKAFAEQYEMFGTDKTLQPTYQQLIDMKYLELVIKEGLRLFPSVPFILRTTTTLTELGDHLLPPNTAIVLSIRGLGTNQHVYEQPYKFRPERFDAQSRTNDQAFDYVPFSAGPRNCIGQKFAMMELKCTLSKLLRHFEVLPAVDGLPEGIHEETDPNDVPTNSYDTIPIVQVTLKSANGLLIRLKKRSYSSD